MWREDEHTRNSETDSNKMKRDCWTAKQIEVLVTMWKENYKELVSSKQHSVWMQIKNKIDRLGNPKTLKQSKTKLMNMKDAQKVSKDNNKKTGRSSFCAHFDVLDEVLGRRDFLNPPFATQVGLNEHGKDNSDNQTGKEGKNCISIIHFTAIAGTVTECRFGGELGKLSNCNLKPEAACRFLQGKTKRMISLKIAGHSRQAVLPLTSDINNLCGIIDVCLLSYFAYQTNSFLNNYEPEDDTPSEMDDDNLHPIGCLGDVPGTLDGTARGSSKDQYLPAG